MNGIIVNVFGNAGISANDNDQAAVFQHIDNGNYNLLASCVWTPCMCHFSAYYVANWNIVSKFCKTNIATNTACRSPGKKFL